MADIITSADIDALLATANNAAARTSLGLGSGDTVTFNSIAAASGGTIRFASGTQLSPNGDGGLLIKNNAGATKVSISSAAVATFGDSSIAGTGEVLSLTSSFGTASVRVGGGGQLNTGGNFGAGGGHVYAISDSGSFTLGTSADTRLWRDAAGTLALRNGTNAQAFRLYNTYTDASNYERLAINWASNECRVSMEHGGTGSLRIMEFYQNGTTHRARFHPGNGSMWLYQEMQLGGTAGVPNTRWASSVSKQFDLYYGTSGTNDCKLRVATAMTNASNGCWLQLFADETGGANKVESVALGTGTLRPLHIGAGGAYPIRITTGGAVLMPTLPTSDPSVTGQLWNDGGTLKVSA